MQQLSLKLCFFYCQYQVLIYYSFEFLWLPGLYVSWSNGQYCLIDMSSFSPSMVTAQQWNFVIVNIPVVTYNVSWTSIRTLNGKYLFHHTIHSSSEDFLLFLIFSLLSTSQFLYYFQCCVVFSVGTICVLQYDVLYWLVWYCLSGVAKCIRFMFGSPGLLSLHFNVWRWYVWDETHPYYIFHMTLLMKLFEFYNFFLSSFFHFLSSIYSAYHHWIFSVHRCWCEVKYLVNSHGVE